MECVGLKGMYRVSSLPWPAIESFSVSRHQDRLLDVKRYLKCQQNLSTYVHEYFYGYLFDNVCKDKLLCLSLHCFLYRKLKSNCM